MVRDDLLSAAAEKRILQFGELQVDPVRRLLLRDGEVVPITPKAFSILLVLLEQPGRVVDKKEMIQRVWPDTFVTEANLTQNISSLRKVLGERAGDRRYVVTVPGKGYSFVADVVEAPEAPALPTGPQVAPVFAGEPAGPVAMSPPGVIRFRRQIAGVGITVLAVIASLTLMFLWSPWGRNAPEHRQEEVIPGTPAVARRPSLAVLGFKNLSGEARADWLAPALAEMLTTELAAGGRVRVVSGQNVARARQSLSLPYTDSLDSTSLQRLHDLLNADRLILGSYVSLSSTAGRRIRLDLRVIDLPSGAAAAALTEVGTEAELFDLVSRSGAGLRRALRLAEPSPEQARAIQARRPSTPESARLYAQGLARLRSYDYPGARDLLLQAAAADPASPAIHAELSRTWSELGHDTRAVQEARRALELASALAREDRLALEARFYEAKEEWGRASEIYRSLWTFFPDDIDYGLQLAFTLGYAGRGPEAMETLRTLRRLPPPVRDDPRIDLIEATTALRLSDTATEKRAAEAAILKGRKSGEKMLVAEALVLKGGALLIEGKAQEALVPFEEARDLYEQAGHSMGVCKALGYTGLALFQQGSLSGSEIVFLQALGIAQRLGSFSNIAALYGNLGRLYQTRGELDRALDYLEKGYAQLAEVDDPLMKLRVLYSLGAILSIQGELDRAAQRLEEVIAQSRAVGSRMDEGRALGELASVLAAQGHLDEARRHGERALQLLQGQSYPGISATALTASADVLVRLGDLPLARQRYGRALAARRQAGDRIGEGQVLGSLARLALGEGGLARARQLGEEQLEIGRAAGARALEAAALRNLGAAALAAGDLEQARASLGAALGTSAPLGETLLAATIRLDLARLDLFAGRPVEAARRSREVAAWAAPRRAEVLESEALAVAAEALLRQGDVAGARAAARQVQARVDRSEDRELRVVLAPVLARAEAAAGDGPGALRRLHRAVEDGARLGFVTAGLEARLTLAELELRQGDPAKARSALEGVRRDAETRGLRRLAAAAAAARNARDLAVLPAGAL